MVGCRVVSDPRGQVAELHIVSAGDRPPKLIIRDVQSLLLVRFNLHVPHRRVSVAVLREPGFGAGAAWAGEQHGVYEVGPAMAPAPIPAPPQPPGAAPQPPGAAPQPPGAAPQLAGAAAEPPAPTPQPYPLMLDEVGLSLAGPLLRVRVCLQGARGRRLTGQAEGPNAGITPALLGAQAVMLAVEGQPEWRGVRLQWVDLAGELEARAVVVSVTRYASASPGGSNALAHRSECVGAWPANGNMTLAAAVAALQALAKLLSPPPAAV